MGKKLKAILITDNGEMEDHLEGALKKNGIEVDASYTSLNSLRAIRRSIVDTGNTVFIRKAFSRLMADQGPPRLVILDYRIDLGLDYAKDPDNRKVLRTLFISYIILLYKEGIGNILGDFILIADDEFANEVKQFEKSPVSLLDILHTTNQDVNIVIERLKKDPATFNDHFKIHLLPSTSSDSAVEKLIQEVLQGTPQGAAHAELHSAAGESTPVSPNKIPLETRQERPLPRRDARVLVKTPNGDVFIDGRRADPQKSPAYRNFAVNELYILGDWDSRNQGKVAEKIVMTVTDGIAGKKFGQTEEIVIHLCSQTIIDTTTASSLVKLFLKDLEDYENKKIHVNFKNANILEKSSGYSMIKKFVRHNY